MCFVIMHGAAPLQHLTHAAVSEETTFTFFCLRHRYQALMLSLLPYHRGLTSCFVMQPAGRPRPGGGITLKLLIDEGILVPGENVLTVEYKSNVTYGSLAECGRIKCTIAGSELTFESPSAFSIYLKRLINPARKADDGWKTVKFEGKVRASGSLVSIAWSVFQAVPSSVSSKSSFTFWPVSWESLHRNSSIAQHVQEKFPSVVCSCLSAAAAVA